MGTPVVATRVGGVPDCVRDGETGYLLAADDETGLVERCVQLLEDRSRCRAMGALAADVMRASFSRAAMAARYLALAGMPAGGPAESTGRPQ
jgi:glycosyltransferase involved in cell wall biosynthesis